MDGGRYADVQVAQHFEYLSEYAGALCYIEAHVVFGLQRADGVDANIVGKRQRRRGQHIADHIARYVHDVGGYGAGGGHIARAPAVKQHAPGEVGLHLNGVQHAVHFGEHHIRMHKRRMHARLHRAVGFACDGE